MVISDSTCREQYCRDFLKWILDNPGTMCVFEEVLFNIQEVKASRLAPVLEGKKTCLVLGTESRGSRLLLADIEPNGLKSKVTFRKYPK